MVIVPSSGTHRAESKTQCTEMEGPFPPPMDVDSTIRQMMLESHEGELWHSHQHSRERALFSPIFLRCRIILICLKSIYFINLSFDFPRLYIYNRFMSKAKWPLKKMSCPGRLTL
jgi:hypothetical protein